LSSEEEITTVMRRYYFSCLAMLLFIFLPAFVYAVESPAVQEKADSVPEPSVERGSAAEQTASVDAVSEPYVVAGADEEKTAGAGESVLEQEPENGGIAAEETIADPLEPWNRVMFTFNDKLYFWVVKPVARGYSAVIPEWGRVRVSNVFQNVTMPVRFVNNLLQLKIRSAGTEVLRFVFNTIAGVGGMFDVAKNIGLNPQEEDLGQTLGVYGIGNVLYLVWPVLGPSSLRDTVGTVGDYFLDPVNYITPTATRIGVHSLDYTNRASLHIGDYEDLKESALDPYIAFRNAYLQYRNNKIKE
jgi:phospholipid-binding lipoprotein MlaA